MKRETREGTRRFANEALAVALAFAKEHGFACIAERMQRIARRSPTGRAEVYHRQEVSQWLHADPDKRVEPKLGAGLMIIEAVRELEAEKTQGT